MGGKAYEKLIGCLSDIREKTDFLPEIGIVLGSGLGDIASEMDIRSIISYKDIAGMPVSGAAGHRGRYVFGVLNGVRVVIMQGRVHYYEGYGMSDVVLPIRLMGLLGVKALILTNAAGGINPGFSAGELMLITGHISSFVPSPLIGSNPNELGARFPDMSEVYDKALCGLIRETAQKSGIALKEGVYVQVGGPNYETPEEIRFLGVIGADAVGMSTACEAIAARHMGIRVCGISCISNLAAGLSPHPLTHDEVKETGRRVLPVLGGLIAMSAAKISEVI